MKIWEIVQFTLWDKNPNNLDYLTTFPIFHIIWYTIYGMMYALQYMIFTGHLIWVLLSDLLHIFDPQS